MTGKGMQTVKIKQNQFITAIALLVISLTGCESGENSASDDSKEAARDNIEAMAKEHADDTTDASPGALLAPSRTVVSQTMAYTEYKDELVYGYFSAPADMFEPLPAVIMIHEWWGLNDNIRAMADRLAAEGYIVFAADLYGGKVAATAGEARVLMTEVVESPESANANISAAYDFLANTVGAPRIGSVGWCFGGAWSLNTAKLFPEELDATVIYYGAVTNDEEVLGPIDTPILGLFGADDTGIKVESVVAFRDALERLRKNHAVHIYPGVGHAFANPTGRNYDEASAEDAWKKTLQFFQLHLSDQ
jgi:carboxymethylenebutenolidase